MIEQSANLAGEFLREISRFFQSPDTLKIVEIARNDKAPVQSFAEAIGADPLFAARIIRLTNFVPGLAQRFATLPAVVNAVGLDNLKALALGLVAFALPRQARPEEPFGVDHDSFKFRDLWEHCLGSAVIAGQIAVKLRHASPAQAFAAGFIHDMGKVLLSRQAQARFVAAATLALEKQIPSTEAEILTFGVDHVRIGEEWSAKVEFAPPLQAVIHFHHDRVVTLPDSVDHELKHLIAMVQIADAHCEGQAIGKGGDSGEWPRELRTVLNFSEEDGPEPAQLIKREIESVREVFGFPKQDIKKLPLELRNPARNVSRIAPLRRKHAVRAVPREVDSSDARYASALKADDRSPLGKLAILVVEDHSSLCDLLSLYLMRHGYHVRTASHGQGALEILAKEEIHLVLLDLMLPRVDGFEVLRQLHNTRQDKTPYIIVVSAGASERDRKKVLELGADEYMPKPFHLLRLLERIQVVEKYLL